MELVSLPLLPDDLSVADGIRAARDNRFSGVVTTGSGRFTLHSLNQLMEAIRADPAAALSDVLGDKIESLPASEIVSNGLDLVEPNDQTIDNFLKLMGQKARVASVSDNPRSFGRLASLLIRNDIAGNYIAVAAHAYRCSIGHEVIDEDQLPLDGRCRLHKGGIYVEQG